MKALKNEICNNIIELTKEKIKLQCDLLLADLAESRAREMITAIKKTPNDINSIEDFDFKSIFQELL